MPQPGPFGGLVASMSSLRRDLAHALRSLARARGFTLVCIVSLGIGMGGVVALATFYRALTSPARGLDPDGLVELLVLPRGPLRAKAGTWALEQWSYPDYQALRDAHPGMSVTAWTEEFSEFGAPTPDDPTPPRVSTLYVTPNYFGTVGVTLARGPGFDRATDDRPSAAPRVVVSHDFWRTRLAADPDIVGKSITLDGSPHTVVGVTPEGFRGHFHPFDSPASVIFVPLEQHPRLAATPALRNDRTSDWLHVYGRLDPGVDIRQANALVQTMVAGLAERYPATNEFKGATVEPYAALGAAGLPQSRQVFAVLLGLTGTVLLIVCLNISGMMLVRGAIRERELAVRAALGADRLRLVQHLFIEAVVIAVVGGAGSAFVLFGVPALGGWWLGAPVPPELDFDLAGLAISSGLCLLVSVLFGLLPALRFSRPDLVPALKDDTGAGGRHTIRVHRVAAMVQVGIAVPFLVISGVMIDRARTADFGFDTEGLAAARLPVPTTADQEFTFSVRRVRDGLREASGVRAVAMAEGMPIDFDYRELRISRPDGVDVVTSQVTRVGEGFLETLHVPILRGRTITYEDRIMASPVAVISEPLATRLFAGAEPLGETITITLADGREETATVVGVSADFATSQLTTERPQILLPMAETLAPTVQLIARGAPGSEPQLRAALETALRELGVEAEPGVAFGGIVTGQDLVDKSLQDVLIEGTVVAVAGSLVLILASLGILGVVSFMVATRGREIAVRMALGSTRLGVFRMMLADVVKLVVPGVAGGLLLAAVLIRTMESVMGTPLRLGPDPLGVMEPVIYAGASAVAILGALVAAFPAARRATSVQPMSVMREG